MPKVMTKEKLDSMDLADSLTWTKWGKGDESRHYFLTECETYALFRLEYLGQPFMAPKDLGDVPPHFLAMLEIESGKFNVNMIIHAEDPINQSCFSKSDRNMPTLGVSLSIPTNKLESSLL